jgi:Zn-dependent protease
MESILLKGQMVAIFVYIVVLFFSGIIHEVSHGYVAYLKGDDTAKMLGRITLNPILHIEFFGTVMLPVILLFLKTPVLFGWAKPVPVNYRNLKNPKVDIPIVSFSGPASNMLLATMSGLGIYLIRVFPNFERGFGESIEVFLYLMLTVNTVLSIVNLIPIPPLDGSKIITYFLPEKIAIKYLNFNPYVCLGVIFVLISSGIVWRFVCPIVTFLTAIFGIGAKI